MFCSIRIITSQLLFESIKCSLILMGISFQANTTKVDAKYNNNTTKVNNTMVNTTKTFGEEFRCFLTFYFCFTNCH